MGHIYVSQSQEKSAGIGGALRRARIDRIRMLRFASLASRPIVPALEQNQTSICSLELRRAVAEDWVCVLCQSRNNSWWASGEWTPSHSGL